VHITISLQLFEIGENNDKKLNLLGINFSRSSVFQDFFFTIDFSADCSFVDMDSFCSEKMFCCEKYCKEAKRYKKTQVIVKYWPTT
jgi:hypothetical protein